MSRCGGEPNGEVVTSEFRGHNELEASLDALGYRVREIRQAPDPPAGSSSPSPEFAGCAGSL